MTWSSYIVLTEPIPDRLADIGWTGGEGLADARFTLHYLRTTPDGRIAIGGGGGRAGFGGRIGPAFTDDAQSTARAAAGLRRLFPSLRDVRIEDAWGGPIDITADHLPSFASVPGRPIHFGHGYSGNGVAPSVVGGRILAALAVEASRRSGPGAAARRRPCPAPSRRSPSDMRARESSARRSSDASSWRSRAGRSTGSCARSPGSRSAWATTSGWTEAGPVRPGRARIGHFGYDFGLPPGTSVYRRRHSPLQEKL